MKRAGFRLQFVAPDQRWLKSRHSEFSRHWYNEDKLFDIVSIFLPCMRLRNKSGVRSLAYIGLALVTFVGCQSAPEATLRTISSEDVGAIRAVVDRYIASVDAADAELARQVWAERDDISFIHPLGHEEGWEQIKSNIYEKLMGGMFSTRKLTIDRIAYKSHGQAVVVEFYWLFNAKWRKDDSPLTTRGRETQVLVQDSKVDWRLAHVHYSGLPATGTSQGF